MQRISRRDALKLLGAAMGVATVLPLPASARTRAQNALGESYRTFTPSEAETVKAIVSRLFPADKNRPGALKAGVDRYIDRALSGALKSSRSAYTTGLAAVNAQAQSLRSVAFSRLSPVDQDAVLSTTKRSNAAFFKLIRAHTIQGILSDIARRTAEHVAKNWKNIAG